MVDLESKLGQLGVSKTIFKILVDKVDPDTLKEYSNSYDDVKQLYLALQRDTYIDNLRAVKYDIPAVTTLKELKKLSDDQHYRWTLINMAYHLGINTNLPLDKMLKALDYAANRNGERVEDAFPIYEPYVKTYFPPM